MNEGVYKAKKKHLETIISSSTMERRVSTSRIQANLSTLKEQINYIMHLLKGWRLVNGQDFPDKYENLKTVPISTNHNVVFCRDKQTGEILFYLDGLFNLKVEGQKVLQNTCRVVRKELSYYDDDFL